MTDGVAITAGSGTTIATDDCGVAGHAQIVKLAYATDGAATAIPADVNGLTVQGAVTATLSATDNSVLDAIALAVGTDGDAYGDGVLIQGDDGTNRRAVLVGEDGHVQVDVLACASHAVTNAGTFAVQAAPAEHAKTMKHARVALTASQTGITVLDPTNGTKFVLHKLIVSCATAGAVQFFDETDSGNTVIGPIYTFAANGGTTETWDMDAPYRSAATNNVLKYTTSTLAGSVYIEYWEE